MQLIFSKMWVLKFDFSLQLYVLHRFQDENSSSTVVNILKLFNKLNQLFT